MADETEAVIKTPLDQIIEIEKQLDDYVAVLGLGKVVYNEGVENVLSIDYDKLSNLSSEETREFSFLLAQYALHIQRKLNRCKSVARWSEKKLNDIIGNEINNYGTQYTKYEEKKLAIIAGNSAASVWNTINIKWLMKADELDGICHRLNSMSYAIKEVRGSRNDD